VVMNWEKKFLSELCVCVHVPQWEYVCFVSVLVKFHCIKLLILNLSRMKKTPYWMQQIPTSHVNLQCQYKS